MTHEPDIRSLSLSLNPSIKKPHISVLQFLSEAHAHSELDVSVTDNTQEEKEVQKEIEPDVSLVTRPPIDQSRVTETSPDVRNDVFIAHVMSR